MGFRPLADRVYAKVASGEEKTESGLFIPDTAKEKPQKAVVQAIGKEVEDVKVGDTVLFAKYSGNEIKIDDDDFIILKIDDILGVFE